MEEKEIIELLKGKSLEEIFSQNVIDEELFYKLSPERGNVLSCVDFKEDDIVLELSHQCYSMTLSYLDKVRSVAKITKNPELEKAIYGERVKCLETIDDERYSKIILNGVLDYLSFEEAKALIEDMKEHLLPDGVIIMILTNKYSINLLSGMKQYDEKDYFTSLTSKRMFSKKKISNILDSLTLSHYFYYPLPGYLAATEIYSEDYLPEENTIKGIKDAFIGKRYVVFDDDLALNKALEEGDFELFTPSYLILASKKK